MLRDRLNEALKEATLAKDTCATATIRLILAALKDRDIAVRSKDNSDAIGDDDILRLLQTMVKQRRESIDMYRKGNREDLADREAREIEVIQRFLPEQMGDASVTEAVEQVISDVGARGLKEMGKVMSALRERYAGRMDFAKASAVAKQKLS
ncbi:MAG: GatB/YqeY domain-containing protein [Alphaproteobacteria bacterium]|nr:GatB/YqeY domain-containing protein [Alphaproteobacteria bacterium]